MANDKEKTIGYKHTYMHEIGKPINLSIIAHEVFRFEKMM